MLLLNITFNLFKVEPSDSQRFGLINRHSTELLCTRKHKSGQLKTHCPLSLFFNLSKWNKCKEIASWKCVGANQHITREKLVSCPTSSEHMLDLPWISEDGNILVQIMKTVEDVVFVDDAAAAADDNDDDDDVGDDRND